MGYDALTPGLKDFDQGVANLKRLSKIANFPFLSGNIIEKETRQNLKWLTPIIYKQIGQTKLAIIGLTLDNIPELGFPENTKGLIFLSEVVSAQKQVKEAKDKGADIVIMLAHLGIPYNRQDEFEKFMSRLSKDEKLEKSKGLNAMELAHLVEGVDVIVTGGIAKGYDEKGMIFKIRKHLQNNLRFLPKKQSGWAHIPIDRILEPIGSKKFTILCQILH